MDLDVKYIKAACMAASFSKDPSTKVGAVLVDSMGVYSRGYNHIPSYAGKCITELSQEDKLALVVHAEREAIVNVARSDRSARGTTLYCTWGCCPHCAIDIVIAGIHRFVGVQKLVDMTPSRWVSDVGAGLDILIRGGVVCDWVDETLDVEVLFDGKMEPL